MTTDNFTERARIPAPCWDNVLCPPALVGVHVDDGEDVEWIWTHDADGRSTVTGYRIVSKLPSGFIAR